jgi:hypothetical protein
MKQVLRYLRAQWDRVGAWVCVLAGAVALFVGWLGVSDTVLIFNQIPYLISGGLVGVFLLGLGAMLWLSADLRDEWRKLDAIEGYLAAGERPPGGQEHVSAPAESESEGKAVLPVPNGGQSREAPKEVQLGEPERVGRRR